MPWGIPGNLGVSLLDAASQIYRFWLASSVEAFLRGSASKEQIFVARTTGLLRHLVMEIISTDDHAAGSLQTAFDLLGELLKGNIEVAPNTPCSFPHAPRPVLRRSSDDLTVCMCVSLSVVPQLHISFVEMLSQTQFILKKNTIEAMRELRGHSM